MSLEKNKLLNILKKIMSDKKMLDIINNIQEPEKIFKIIQDLGYDKNFKEFCIEISKIVNINGTQELSDSELENVAGGISDFKRIFLTALSSLSVMSSSGQAYVTKNNITNNYQENSDKITINMNINSHDNTQKFNNKVNVDIMNKFLKYTAGSLGVLASLGIVVYGGSKLYKFVSGNSESHINFFSEICENLDKIYNKIKQNPNEYLELYNNNIKIKDSKQNDLIQDIFKQFNNIGINIDIEKAKNSIFMNKDIITSIWNFLGEVLKNLDNSDNLLQNGKKFKNNIKKISDDYSKLLEKFKDQNKNISKKDESKIIIKEESNIIESVIVQEEPKYEDNIKENKQTKKLNSQKKSGNKVKNIEHNKKFQENLQKVQTNLNLRFVEYKKDNSKSKNNSSSSGTSQSIVPETQEFKDLKQKISNMKNFLNGQTKKDDDKKEEYKQQSVQELRKNLKFVKKQDGSSGIAFANASSSPQAQQKIERQKPYLDIISLLVGQENFEQISSNMGKDLQTELKEKISNSNLILNNNEKEKLRNFIDKLNIPEVDKPSLKSELENNNYVRIFDSIWKEMINIGTSGQDGKVGITDEDLVKSTTNIMDSILIGFYNQISEITKENYTKEDFFREIYNFLDLESNKLYNDISISNETKKIIIYYLDNILYTVGNIQKYQNNKNYLVIIFKTIKANHNNNKITNHADTDKSKNKYINSFCVPSICRELNINQNIVSSMFVRYSEGDNTQKNTKSTVHQQLNSNNKNVMKSIYTQIAEFLGIKPTDLS